MSYLTDVHVTLSFISIATGLVVLYGLITGSLMNSWSFLFFLTTFVTSVTGFLFAYHGFTPALAVGVLSIATLFAAMVARYHFHFRGPWRAVYVVGTVVALYLNSFVLVVQVFLKIPVLHRLAPTGSETPFVLSQSILLAVYLGAGTLAIRGFGRIAVGRS
jgi:hypothetical protein